MLIKVYSVSFDNGPRVRRGKAKADRLWYRPLNKPMSAPLQPAEQNRPVPTSNPQQTAPVPSSSTIFTQPSAPPVQPVTTFEPIISPNDPFVYPELGDLGDGGNVDINSWVNMIPDNVDLGWLLPAGLGDLNADETGM